MHVYEAVAHPFKNHLQGCLLTPGSFGVCEKGQADPAEESTRTGLRDTIVAENGSINQSGQATRWDKRTGASSNAKEATWDVCKILCAVHQRGCCFMTVDQDTHSCRPCLSRYRRPPVPVRDLHGHVLVLASLAALAPAPSATASLPRRRCCSLHSAPTPRCRSRCRSSLAGGLADAVSQCILSSSPKPVFSGCLPPFE